MDDLPELPEDVILGRMARFLRARAEHRIGSPPWMAAVSGYADCRAELDRRLLRLLLDAMAERGELP